MKSKGLGDSIEKITTKTGIKSLMDFATESLNVRDCGCNKRKKWLNEKFPYNKK
jgi:hypothetical protein